MDRQTYKNQWARNNLKTIRGFRPTSKFFVNVNDSGIQVQITPADFFVHPEKTRTGPFKLYGTSAKTLYHIPRSLLKRAKMQIYK